MEYDIPKRISAFDVISTSVKRNRIKCSVRPSHKICKLDNASKGDTLQFEIHDSNGRKFNGMHGIEQIAVSVRL